MKRAVRRPNFFIIGAPKSGTTAMYTYLRKHPDVFMPEVKELNFFGSDLRVYSPYFNDARGYLSWFEGARDEKMLGEASVWYLYSKKAGHEIKNFDPKAKIIIMLRNPVDMLYSLHNEFLFKGYEDIEGFEEALEAEEDRKEGKRIPKICRLPQVLFYKEVGSYFNQVKRYLDAFGDERVHIIIFDDFKKDTARVYKETLKFLEVGDNFITAYKNINIGKSVRSSTFRNILQNPSKFSLKIGEILIPRKFRPHLINLLLKVNTKEEKRKPLNNKTREKLIKVFEKDIKKLSRLTKKDLSNWLQ